jgi:hypothetical protein
VKVLGAATNHRSITAKVEATGSSVTVTFDPAVAGWETGRLCVTVLTDCIEEQEVQIPVVVHVRESSIPIQRLP